MPAAGRPPNILITGTPGTGKSTLAAALAEEVGFNVIDISKLALEKQLHEGKDEDLDCLIIDEDKICDDLEDTMSKGGNIVDYHSSEFFPERWFDLVVVLRTDNTPLYDRLVARGYSEKKVSDNVTCEIFQTCLEEARESYRPEIVWELKSNIVEQVDDNVAKIVSWLRERHS